MIRTEDITLDNWDVLEDLILKSEEAFPPCIRTDSEGFLKLLRADGVIAKALYHDSEYIGNVFGCSSESGIDLGFSAAGLQEPPPNTMHLYSIVIDLNHQREGHGKHFLNDFIDAAREEGYTNLTGFFRPNVSLALIRKLGAEEVSMHLDWYGTGENYTYCRMKIS